MSATSDLPKKSHRVFLAGDALITKPWSGVDDRAFLDLVGEMRQANTTIINLETLIHEYKGYAQAHSGGAYMTSPPEIATELKWADVNMVSHANNHAFDYGSEGIIETHENIGGAGIVIAGTAWIYNQRAPRSISTATTRMSRWFPWLLRSYPMGQHLVGDRTCMGVLD